MARLTRLPQLSLLATDDGGNGSLDPQVNEGDTAFPLVRSALVDCGKPGEDVVSTGSVDDTMISLIDKDV